MNRQFASIALAVLLAVSLSIKFKAGAGGGPMPAADDADIGAIMSRRGFAVTPPAPATDPRWYEAGREDCRIGIARISPQGWHRSAVEWKAQTTGGTAFYLTEQGFSDRQAVLRSTLAHYWRRFQRYLGMAAPPPRVLAVVLSPDCPDAYRRPEAYAELMPQPG